MVKRRNSLSRPLALLWIICSILLIVPSAAPLLHAQETLACPPSREANRYGVVEQLGWTFLYRSEDTLRQTLALLQEAGIGWVRLNWTWKDMQRTPGPFTYDRFDLVAALAAEYDIELVPILMSVPPWSSTAPDELKAERGDLAPVDRYRPADLNDWLTYTQNVVERYDGDGVDDAPGSPRIHYWEVWNEQNISLFWPPAVDVNEYVELLRQTHTTIRAADPTAIIGLGGLAGNGVRNDGRGYLQALYAANAASYFDVVSIHLYLHPTEDTLDELIQSVEATRRVMDENGDDAKPLWLTEIGWSDASNAWDRPTASQDDIAAWLTALYTAPLPADVIFWYNFRNISDESSDVEHNFGLMHNNFTPKPAWEAYSAVIQQCQ